MTSINTETETVVKKILPYLQRRGYDISKDLDFETGVTTTTRYSKGYIDILVKAGRAKPVFLIEAKKISKRLSQKDRDQALSYANSKEIKVPFVVVTNGIDIQCYNSKSKAIIFWDSKTTEKIPTKDQLKTVLRALKSNPLESNINISKDESLPYRAGLALRQLNRLFYKCHSAIRKIEKNEENSFADFSKLLFLKLLEEKEDVEDRFILPYSYRFHELADKPISEADQVKDSIMSMIDSIVKSTPFGEVLEDKLMLKNPKTFQYIVRELAAVSFYDSSLDSKGAAFEYFVRATLKGKKLGQYFTPRELVQCMLHIIGKDKIANSLITGSSIKILDPACGTGGFLVYLMQESISQVTSMFHNRKITKQAADRAIQKIKEDVFFGSDANEGVAASAKMNMIIAGDGHTNIQNEDSLSVSAKNWKHNSPDCDLILTNPPFGTAEKDSLEEKDLAQYEIKSGKGQHYFLQKMVMALKPNGEICTVIDEGVLNTESSAALRRWVLQQCELKAVFRLPPETFKPNKINVKSSLLYLVKRETPDTNLDNNYLVTVCEIDSLGYSGSGDKIRGFDTQKLLSELAADSMNSTSGHTRLGYHWKAYNVEAKDIIADTTHRFDFKYWDSDIRKQISQLITNGSKSISELNTITTSRGKSPSAENYVDQADGYALVIKSGSNVNKYGYITTAKSDWIEKSVYDEYVAKAKSSGANANIVKKGDVLLSSTGDGTLGKSAVYDLKYPAIADGHITIIRVDKKIISPQYLCDYLRLGHGSNQIERLFTGSTGMIELTPDQVDTIIVDMRSDIKDQKYHSRKLRTIETRHQRAVDKSNQIAEEVQAYLKKI